MLDLMLVCWVLMIGIGVSFYSLFNDFVLGGELNQ